MSLELITELSRELGTADCCNIAACGNSSFKTANEIWIKPCNVALADTAEKDFVKLQRAVLRGEAPAAGEDPRAFCPSLEAVLHNSLPSSYVLHLHTPLADALSCGKDGEKIAKELFPEALFVNCTDSCKMDSALEGRNSGIIFLKNNGLILAGESVEEIRKNFKDILAALAEYCAQKGIAVSREEKMDNEAIQTIAPKLRTILGEAGCDGVIRRKFVTAAGNFALADGVVLPAEFRFAKGKLKSDAPTMEEVKAFTAANGEVPTIVEIPGKAVFAAGNTLAEAGRAAGIIRLASEAARLAAAFGGADFLPETKCSNADKCTSCGEKGRLAGKVAVITGAAQGFGYGIAEELAREGAVIVIADMNQEGASKAADEIRSRFPQSQAFAVAVNVSDEASVENMTRAVAEKCGGIDLFVANAGVVRAGSVKEITLKDWEFVTDINYNGYFLCVKHVARLMSCQTADGGDWLDIVQVNSKSGLQGSNKNGAYAGGKFGGIGLTQSFAMELVTDRIKVNSVCPGNFFDGPLWSNPEKGLFVQYLNSGKVPGAKTVEDVKKFYESKIPMNRGCFPADVAKAILYAVEQKYETGQAIPVTGGQVMLK